MIKEWNNIVSYLVYLVFRDLRLYRKIYLDELSNFLFFIWKCWYWINIVSIYLVYIYFRY